MAAALLLVTAGCGESPIGRSVFGAIQYSVFGQKDAPITRDLVTNLPYASVAAKIGKGPRSLLILWRKDNAGDLHWVSADGVVLVTRNGRIIKTAGLPENIIDSRMIGTDPISSAQKIVDPPAPLTREIDIDVDHQFGLVMNCKVRNLGERKIRITELDFETILIRERCKSATLNWSFTNYFWVDPADQFVWKSEQHIARTFPPIVIEILKPSGI